MLPPDAGLPLLMLKSWLKRWHADVPWMVNAAWAIRRGDDRGGALSSSELVSRQIGVTIIQLSSLVITACGAKIWTTKVARVPGGKPKPRFSVASNALMNGVARRYRRS